MSYALTPQSLAVRRPSCFMLMLAVTVAAVAANIPALLTTRSAAPIARVRSDADVAALPPAQQAALLAPLRELAADFGSVGRSGAGSKAFSGVALDAVTGVVMLYATNVAAGRTLLARVAHSDGNADLARVRVVRSTYGKHRMDAAIQALIAEPDRPAGLVGLSAAVDGSGITAEVLPGSRLVGRRGSYDGVAVRYRTGFARTPKSWAAVKWHDSTPFIGGDTITNGSGYCTTGLPAVRRSDGHRVMVTAAHCFRDDARVFTAAGPAGQYHNGMRGNYVGTVSGRIPEWDAETLDGADNNADESDTNGWKPLTSVGYSYVGDYVCQNGAASFFLGHPTPCGIKVTDGDLWFPIGGYWARGVEGVDVRNGWGSHGGDSGGTVFAATGANTQQARGIISSGGADGTPDQRRVDWTEAPDIFAAFGLRLNPVT